MEDDELNTDVQPSINQLHDLSRVRGLLQEQVLLQPLGLQCES